MKKISRNCNTGDDPEKEKDALELLRRHENIIKCFKYFENDDSYYFIYEYCPYGSLDTFMKLFERTPIKLV